MTKTTVSIAKWVNKWKKQAVIAFFLSIFLSCYTPGSFKVSKHGPGSNRTIALYQLTQKNPYVIVHKGDSAWNFNNYKLNNDNTTITGYINPLPNERNSYKIVNPNTTNIAKAGNTYPFDEMHVKVLGMVPDSNGRIVIHNDSILEIQVYNEINVKKKNA